MRRTVAPMQSPRMSGENLVAMRSRMPMYDAFLRLFQAVRNEGTLSVAQKDTVRLKTAAVARCEY